MELDEHRAIGDRIADARRSAGLTQRELAGRLGVTVRTVQNYEAGVAVPYRYLRTIETLGHKPPGWILRGGEDSDLLATLRSLQASIEHHHEVLVSHLDELRRHMDSLREQRSVIGDRLGGKTADSAGAVRKTPDSSP